MKKLFKNISIYSMGGIINKSIQFLLLPLYTRVLVPADYGKLELVYLVGAILAIANGFLIQNAYARFYFDKTEQKDYRGKLYSSAMIFVLLSSALTFYLCFSFAEAIADKIFDFIGGIKYVKLIAISYLLMSLSSVPEKTLIVQQKPKIYVIINIINLLITISFTVYFVLVLSWGVEGVLWGQIIGRSLRFFMMFTATIKYGAPGFSIQIITNLLAFSIFLIPTQLSSFVTYLSNRLFLQEYNTLEDVGIFSLAYKIASIIPLLITMPVKMAFGPHIYSQIKSPNICKENLREFTSLFFLIISSFALILSMFSKEIIFIMSDAAYWNSYKLVFPLSISYVFIGVAGIVVIAVNIVKKTWIIAITWVLASGVNLILNYILI